jgi:hypothetical protein
MARVLIGFVSVLAVTVVIDLTISIVTSEPPDPSIAGAFLVIVFCTTVGTLGLGLVVWLPLFSLVGVGVQYLRGKLNSGDEPVVPNWIKSNPDKKLIVKYIRDRLAVGHQSMEVISAHLRDMGWSNAEIEQAIKEVESTPAVARGEPKKGDHKHKSGRHGH